MTRWTDEEVLFYAELDRACNLPRDAAPLLRVHDLSYSVTGRKLLRQVSLNLKAGELLVVLGRNGAGKSTLLKHLSGELQGRGVELFGQPLGHHKASETAKRRAVLPQQTALSFAFEVLDIVLLGRIPHGGRETPEDRAIAVKCLERVGLMGYEMRNIQTLSGGEQQRVHLARTLAQLDGAGRDRVLLLDEPTASLDLAHQHSTLRLARELCAEGVGVLAILHDLNLAAQYADRVLVLSDGAVLAHDIPAAALTCQTIHAAYGHEVLVTRHPCLNCPLIVSAS
ncbi:heme ABC transporter ATP-binding protein [Deinococcus aquatilis]|uniref:heme ABC transporter ATP-binding protein n=1 Tax=Deinococcus aquatilis TaxID=519440 RepID=UPI00037D9BCC|nr:heme ABC transporter ATP-binding protein [Deinococcus aquatilis]